VSRRSFLEAMGLSAAAVTLPAPAFRGAPAIRRSPPATPVAVSSANSLAPVTRTVELVLQGTDTLDAAVEGVKLQELDPNDNTVGYGGLPNEEGVVQLDASCMHGPSKRAGAVAALEGIKTPSAVAKLVLRYTNHILLVGEGGGQRTELPLDVTIKENLPPKLTLTVDLPTLRTSPTGSLSYSATLKNEGDEEVTC
jgi:N4-(beta-N-acetylglucosaminyl)-L-asparaginase